MLRGESIDDMTLCRYAVQYHGSLGALLDDRSAVVDAVKRLSLDTALSAMLQERILPYGERSAFLVAEAGGNPFHLAYLYIELIYPPHPFLLAQLTGSRSQVTTSALNLVSVTRLRKMSSPIRTPQDQGQQQNPIEM